MSIVKTQRCVYVSRSVPPTQHQTLSLQRKRQNVFTAKGGITYVMAGNGIATTTSSIVTRFPIENSKLVL